MLKPPAFNYGRGAFDNHFANPANNRYDGQPDHIIRHAAANQLGAGMLPNQDPRGFGRRGPGAGQRPADHNMFGVADYAPGAGQPQQHWPHQVPQRQQPQNLPAQQPPPYILPPHQQFQQQQQQQQRQPPLQVAYQQQGYQPDPRTLVAAERQKKKEPAGKIGGDVHVLPARRRAEFLSQQAREQEKAALEQQQQAMLMAQAGVGADGARLPVRDPEEQAWLDAEVTAIRNELASTQIHQEVLDKRRRMLQARLASLGMGAEDEAAY